MIRHLAGRVMAWWRARTGSASTAAVALGLIVCLCRLLPVAAALATAQVRIDDLPHLIATAAANARWLPPP